MILGGNKLKESESLSDLLEHERKISEDPNETKIFQILVPSQELHRANFALVGIPFDSTSIVRRGSSLAPKRIREYLFSNRTFNPTLNVDLNEKSIIANLGDVKVIETNPLATEKRIEKVIYKIVSSGALPIVMGGDHWSTYATVRGLTKHVGKMGLIVFDAHTDVRDKHYGQISSGTPVYRIVENIPNYPVKPENVVEIGINGWHNSKVFFRYIEEKGISVFTMRDVLEKGIHYIVDKAIGIASKNTNGIFLSIDIDSVEAAFAPGTGSPNPGGLTSREILEAVFQLGRCGSIKGFDLVEVFPESDVNDITSILGASIIQNFIAGVITE